MRSLLFFLIGLVLLPSCNMKKYCADRWPAMSHTRDSISYVETVIYRDTTIYFTIPGDTMYKEVYVDTTTQKAFSTLHTNLAMSIADYSAGVLRHTLIQKDSTFQALLQAAIKTHSTHTNTHTELKIPYEVNKVSKWQMFQMTAAWLLAIMVLIGALWKKVLGQLMTRAIQLITTMRKKAK